MYVEKRTSKKSKKGYTWTVKFYYEDENGLKKRYSKSGFATKNEAMNYGLQAQQNISEDKSKPKKHKIDEAWQIWLKTNQKHLAKNTIDTKRRIYNVRIKPVFTKSMDSYTTNDIEKLINNMDLLKSTKLMIRSILKILFQIAVKEKWIPMNPVLEVRIQGAMPKKQKKDTISSEEFNTILEAVRNKKNISYARKQEYLLFLYIGYYSGLRLGEILGLKWEDINFEENTIRIARQKLSDETITETLKTRASYSSIPIALPLKEILTRYKKDQEGFIFTLNYLTVVKFFDNLSKKIGIYFHCHMLRHTFITNLIRAGVDPKTASLLARHSDTSTTLEIYTNMKEDDLKKGIQAAFG